MGKKQGKKIYIIILIYILIIFLQVVNNRVYASEIEGRGFNVLVLNSYNQGHHWEAAIMDGLKSYVKENTDNKMSFKIEYLDFRNNYNEEYIESLKHMLNEKYIKGSIDVIYTVDDEAYEVFNKEVLNPKSSFYKIPLVFSGIDSKLDDTHEKKYMAGIYHGDDCLSLMNLVYSLTQKTESINLIVEDSKYGDSVKDEINKLVDTYLNNQIDIRYIQSNYTKDIINQLKKIKNKPDTINIIAGEFQREKSSSYVEPKELIDEIKKYSSAPIYSNDQTYLNAGILGGHIDMGQEQAKIICDMIVKMKNGVPIEKIESTVEPPAKAYVDYKSIYEYGINPFDVGTSVNIINKAPYDLLAPRWMKYLLLSIFAFFLVSIVFVAKAISRYRKDIKDQLEEEEKAREREQLKSDFIVNLSHELRTPINIILGTTKLLEYNIFKGRIDEEYMLDKLEHINQNSYRLLKISNNIIDMTKAECGMLGLNLENCNIVSIIEDVFESSLEFAKIKNIGMIFDPKYEEIRTVIDVCQIQRVVLNLLSNAIKFTNENGLVYLSIYKEEEQVVLEVKDNGVGIPNNKLNYIFQRFYQVDNLYTRKNEGSGIGLCISKEIVKIHGGKIEIESELEEGSLFRVILPIKIDENLPEYDPKNYIDTNKIVSLEMSDI
ncbi:HAMP domain-containing sensor histidine kinase [Paraclostridium ghonii]|uniref:sensor histidine kinase n=1 Tax=Paraclostridium ghonii TaxID=29358 RepID=UPI00202D01F9|nr:HAMP domain-containing sensor histidine kinase [Paeniclostridium ghonii]MCM0167906.1 HAMP domain-containing histidine kinase [Paeniclostridium ghonii]